MNGKCLPETVVALILFDRFLRSNDCLLMTTNDTGQDENPRVNAPTAILCFITPQDYLFTYTRIIKVDYTRNDCGPKGNSSTY